MGVVEPGSACWQQRCPSRINPSFSRPSARVGGAARAGHVASNGSAQHLETGPWGETAWSPCNKAIRGQYSCASSVSRRPGHAGTTDTTDCGFRQQASPARPGGPGRPWCNRCRVRPSRATAGGSCWRAAWRTTPTCSRGKWATPAPSDRHPAWVAGRTLFRGNLITDPSPG